MDEAIHWHGCGKCVDAIAISKEVLASVDAEGDSAPLWVDFEPPLVYLSRVGKTQQAGALLRDGHAAPCGGVDAIGQNGATALYHAAAQNAADLVKDLLAAGASIDAHRTQDNPHVSLPGGRTPLHAAANTGATEAAGILLSAAPELAAVSDWEGRLPAELAWLCGAHDLALSLASAAAAAVPPADADDMAERLEEVHEGESDASDRKHAATVRRVELRERRREALRVEERPSLHAVHRLRGAWPKERCERLLAAARDAASLHGWSTGRHRHYPTTDLPLWRLGGATMRWVMQALESELLPAAAAAFRIPLASLRVRESFVARYDAGGKGGEQADLAMHKDGTLLAFTITLSDAAGYDGGGTQFAAPTPLLSWDADERAQKGWAERCAAAGLLAGAHAAAGATEADGPAEGSGATLIHVASCAQGDALLQCGQLKHGGAPITRGQRCILVAFVDELRRDPSAAANEATGDGGGVNAAAVTAADAAALEAAKERLEAQQLADSSDATDFAPGGGGGGGDGGAPLRIAKMSSSPAALLSKSGAVSPAVNAGGSASTDSAGPRAAFAVTVVGGTPAVGGGGGGSGGGGCLSKSRSKQLKRTATAGASTPGSGGRRIISFGTLDDPGSAAPERRGRFTLPGGKPAFAPGWNAPIEVTDAETEEEDTKGDAVRLSLTVDGRSLVDKTEVLLSSSGEATVRLPNTCRIRPTRAAIECVLCDRSDATLARAATEPPTDVDEWVKMPGAKRDTRSLSLDVPGFTICFDAATDAEPEPADATEDDEPQGGTAAEDAAGDAAKRTPRYELVAVRIVRQPGGA